MKKMSCVSGILIFSVLLVLNCAGQKGADFWGSAEDGFNLMFKMPVNTEFEMKASSLSQQTMEMMGNEMVTTTEAGSETSYKVISVDSEGNTVMEVEYKDRFAKSEGQAGSMSVDFSAIVGKKVKITVSPKGKILKYEGFEDLPEISRGVPGQGNIGAEDYKQGFEGIFFNLPAEPIKIGGSWPDKIERHVTQGQLEMDVVTDVTYTVLEEVQKDGVDCLKIGIKQKTVTSGSGEQMGVTFTLESEATRDAVLYFAYKKGMYISVEGSQTSEGSAEAQGMTIPIVSETKSSANVVFK
jgi:hypothetical protein